FSISWLSIIAQRYYFTLSSPTFNVDPKVGDYAKSLVNLKSKIHLKIMLTAKIKSFKRSI
ncbi:hypothetical protein, partial [Myroides odoratimimus]|uniref:hypothetical protein n=1 Tax=Myroides odoratimimus TaxID=76832 RepID=UPI0025755B42